MHFTEGLEDLFEEERDCHLNDTFRRRESMLGWNKIGKCDVAGLERKTLKEFQAHIFNAWDIFISRYLIYFSSYCDQKRLKG